jgi:superfamily II DNA helicase RecQ
MTAERLSESLTAAGVPAARLHGDLNQNQRNRNLERFTKGYVRVLVATDVAARGIHVDDVALVVQVDPPEEYKTYLHRAGRTGRAGKEGVVVTLIPRNRRRRMEDLLNRAERDGIFTEVRPSNHLPGRLLHHLLKKNSTLVTHAAEVAVVTEVAQAGAMVAVATRATAVVVVRVAVTRATAVAVAIASLATRSAASTAHAARTEYLKADASDCSVWGVRFLGVSLRHAHKETSYITRSCSSRVGWRYCDLSAEQRGINSDITNLDVERDGLRSQCAPIHSRGNLQRILDSP